MRPTCRICGYSQIYVMVFQSWDHKWYGLWRGKYRDPEWLCAGCMNWAVEVLSDR